MASSRQRVLIVGRDEHFRNILRILLAALKCDDAMTDDLGQALAMLRQAHFDAVLLDLGPAEVPQTLSAILELCPSLAGRVVVIASEAPVAGSHPQLDSSAVPLVSRHRLAADLWPRLQELVGPRPSPPVRQ